MSENLGRAFGGVAALAGLWIAVYWWWEPSSAHSRGTAPISTPTARGSPEADTPSSRVERSFAEPLPAPGSSTTAPTPSLPSPIPAVTPPRFRDYTVRRGDTLASIAQRELGAAKWAEAISRSNPLADLDRLRPGRVIRIPLDPSNIQGKPNPAAPPPVVASKPTTTASPAPTSAPTAQAATTYLVRRGDTLSGIAKAHYGSAAFIPLIAKANSLDDHDSLREGQSLILPPKE
ncbi:MAG: LysM peptidoglycan-binding domain-containing protein [Phycisphaerales bacterium]